MSVQHVNQQNFEEVVLKSDKPVLLDFWATWCGPCKMLTPVLEEVAKELEDKALIVKVDIDENPDLAKKYMVMSVPSLFAINNGEIADRTIGFMDKDAIMDFMGDLV
mgnify:CR=1 FL=1|jgi:thioredoxin 1